MTAREDLEYRAKKSSDQLHMLAIMVRERQLTPYTLLCEMGWTGGEDEELHYLYGLMLELVALGTFRMYDEQVCWGRTA